MTANTDGMLCTWKAPASLWLASTSILARIHVPAASAASRSSTGDSCLHGPHHSAQKSMSTGTWLERSMTSVWKVASVTSMTYADAPASPGAAAAGGAGCGFAFRPGRATAPGSRMSVGRMLTPPSSHRRHPCSGAARPRSGDREPVHRDDASLAALVVGAEDDQLQRVHAVGQPADRVPHFVRRPRRVVVVRRLEDTVDVRRDLALVDAARRVEADARAAEGQHERLALDVADDSVAAEESAAGHRTQGRRQGGRDGAGLTDGERIDGDEGPGRALGALDAEHHDLDGVRPVGQSLDDTSNPELPGGRVVVEGRLADAVDEDPGLALVRTCDGPPGDGAAGERPGCAGTGEVLADDATTERSRRFRHRPRSLDCAVALLEHCRRTEGLGAGQ